MKSLINYYGIISFLIIYTISCEDNSPTLINDFTGQVDTIYDIEGNKYKTIGIGSQIWMAQNLKSIRLSDGTIIPTVIEDSLWARITTPGLCWYNNDSSKYQNIYGPLYNFYTVNTGLLCPVGWHVPTRADWDILSSFLGGDNIAGGKLKQSDGSHWKEPNPCIVSDFRFVALPGGCRRNFNGVFVDLGYTGNWWTSTSDNVYYSESKSMFHDNMLLNRFISDKRKGFSVRCIKN
jgi:uncharacterized protein (TIGR02145 family)